MNEIFSSLRFGKLLKNDIVRYLPRYYGSILIYLAILPAIWAFKSLFGVNAIAPDTRLIIIVIFTFILSFSAPFRIYGNTNHKKWGVDFTMLPASAFEKFLSMTLISTVLLPIVFMILALCIDTILTTIPTNAYQEYMTFERIFTLKNIAFFGEIILFMCFALYGNMLFRKNKLSKTIFSMLAILITISMLFTTATYQYAKRIVYIDHKTEEAYTLVNGKKVTDSTTLKNSIIVDQTNVAELEQGSQSESVSVDESNKSVTITKNNKKYVIQNNSIGRDMISFIDEHYKGLYTILSIIMYVVIPALMYYLTFTRIKKQQL